MERYGLRADKRKGQNFLIDRNILQKILSAGDISEMDAVLEIGPGLGVLTLALSERAGKVVAVETDRRLAPALAETLAGAGNVKLVWENILRLEPHELASQISPGVPKVVSNLPYCLTTPILFHLLESGIKWDRMVFMVQKEVAERITARPGTKDYGLLTLNVRLYGETEAMVLVPPTVFWPAPGVWSAVIRITPQDKPPLEGKAKDAFKALTRAAFGQRRKTIYRALINAGIGAPDAVGEMILKAGIAPDRRGDTLTFGEFINLTGRYLENTTIPRS
ncbi:MAG: 16S rRNA (adenine(1518)-N(6)/adenine(1519)-N(6))-dimethyltransferase RsmA [Bacillota bacterium]